MKALLAAVMLICAHCLAFGADGIELIDTSIENGSPLWHETAPDGTIRIHLIYDHERSSPNRAAGHFHFLIRAKPGAKFVLEFVNMDNVWNGRPGSVAPEMRTVVVSQDGRAWTPVRPEIIEEKRVRLPIEMPGPMLFVARVEPYRISDLNRLLDSIRAHPLVKIETIGSTAEGRELEIVRVGRANAPHRVFLRARAHPWEAGGNWVLQGLIRRLLAGDPDAERYVGSYCVYVLPIANKDGVARGRTRFNSQGKDLNRNWDKPADLAVSPENHALERWLEAMIEGGAAPDLALELHNDGNGRLHISRPPVPNLDRHLKRMELLEELLRKHTWFTEGSTKAEFRNSGTLGEGWLQRFGIDAMVHEFNCQWAAGLNRPPLGRDWEEYGAKLATVLEEYFRRRP